MSHAVGGMSHAVGGMSHAVGGMSHAGQGASTCRCTCVGVHERVSGGCVSEWRLHV